jgi:hypothetical protein
MMIRFWTIRPLDQEDGALEDEGDAHRRDQRSQARRVSQPPVRDSLDDDAEEPVQAHRHEEDQDEAWNQPERRRPLEMKQADQRQANQAAHGVDVPVGEVDQFDDAVDESVAQGDERIDRTGGETKGQLIDEEPHPFSRPAAAAFRLPTV